MNIPYIFSRTGLIPVLALLTATAVQGQPVCSIDLGADHVICQGESVTLQGPAGYINYLWSNGATTQDITVTAGGDYWCEVSYPSGNLVTNGDFSAGNTGFTSEYIYSLTSVQNEGYYTVGPNASWYHTQFQGTGTGNFLIANGGYGSWSNDQRDVWCQTIPCCPGQTYTLSYRGRTLTNAIPARAVWTIDGSIFQWPDLTFPPYSSGWQPFSMIWTAGPGQTSVSACINITSANGVGDDFGIDDISISGTVVLRDYIRVTVTPLPVVNLGADQTLCVGESIQLDATVPGGSYLWQNGSTAPTYPVSGPGTYSVIVTAQNCSNSDQVNVAFNPLPTVDLGPDTVLCAGTTLTLAANSPGYSYLWQDGSTAPTFTVAAPGWYWAQVTQNNCISRDSILVGYKPLPTVSLGNDTAICAGTSLTLDATVSGATYIWQDGSTAPTLLVSTSGFVEVEVDLNGCTAQDAIQVTVKPLPVADLGLDQVVCPGTNATFDATTSGATYLWNHGSTGSTLTTDQPGNYSVQLTVNGCSASDAVTLSNFTLQAVDLGPDRTICAGESATLGVAVPGATYLWNTGVTTESISVSAAGTYWVETVLNGCAVRDSIEVQVTPLPVVTLGPDQQVCPGASVTLDASVPGASYLWNNGATTPSITAGVGSWSVDVTVNGCMGTGAATITELVPPTVDLGPDQVICPGATATFDATTAGATYLWNDGSTSPTLTTDQPGNYAVQVTVNGCTASDAVLLSNFNLQTVDLGPDRTICAGENSMLGVNVPGATYLWNTGAFTDSISASTAGTYWIEATLNGCAVRDSIEMQVTSLPVVSLGPDQQVCPGSTTTLDATLPGSTYLWSNGATTPSITVGVGIWSVDVTLNSCTGSGTSTITELVPPTVDLGTDQVICPGATATFDATTAGATYLWSDGSTGAMLTTDQPGNYSVQVTVNGCSNSDAATLSNFSLQTVSLGPDRTICAGASTMLGLNVPTASYLWNTGATTDSITVTTAGIYWVEATLNGCAVRDSIEIQVTSLPVVSLGATQQVCPGGTATLDATTPGASYLWSNGATTSSITVGAGSWSVDVTVNGCTGTGASNITEVAPPSVDLGPDQVVCPGATATFNATTAGATYLWSDGSTGPELSTDQPGNYTVQVTVNGCTTSDAISLSYFSLQTVNLGPDQTICDGGTATFGIHIIGASYIWNTGATSDSIIVSGAGVYWVEVSVNGCVAHDSIELNMIAPPVVSLGQDQQVCPSGSATLDATTLGGTYLWSNGSTAPSITVGAGSWSVNVTVNGCTGTDAVNITELPPPIVDLGPDTLLCPGESVTLDAGVAGGSFLWSTGATTSSITVSAAMLVSVTVTDVSGCSASDAIQISYANPGTLTLGPDITFCSGSQIILDATMAGATSYQWSDGSTNAILTTGIGGTYWVTIAQGQCTLSDTVVLHSVASPALTLGNDTTLCAGASLLLEVPSTGLQLEWQDGSLGSSFLVENAGIYWVAAINASGCTDTAFVQVSYLGANAFDLGSDTLLCAGASLLLDAGLPGGTTQWSGASSASISTLAVNTAGLYIATTTVGDCSFTDSILVSVVTPLNVNLGADTYFCEGGSVQLTANAASILWDDGSTTSVRTITQAGTYWVQATESGCTASDTVTVIEVPLPTLELGPDTGLCMNELLSVDVTVPGGSYLWNDGSTAPVRSLPAGTWDVLVTATGCSSSDTLRIQDVPSPILNLPNDTTLCVGDAWTIDVAQPDANYSWSTGSTSSSILVTTPGTYGVTVDRNGCVASSQVVVTLVDLGQFSLGPDTVLCPGAELLLSVGIPGVSVLWQDGSTAHQRIVDSPGTYQAVITAGSCTAQSAVNIGFTPLPQPYLGEDQILCMGDSVTLSIDPGPAQFIWSTGGAGLEIVATHTGIYTIELALDGCVSSDSIRLLFSPVIAQLDLGPDQEICPDHPIVLDATTTGASYTWTNGSHMPTFTVTLPGTYSVSATGHCIQASDTIIIRQGSCAPVVHIPNAFTPDGDDINDRFSPSVVEPVRSWTFMIFDRWGEVIFTSTDPHGSWDGTFRGKEAPVGVYVWDLHYEAVTNSGVVQERLRGSVTLVR